MSSISFQERFKDKISTISKQGELGFDCAKPIARDPRSAIQASANIMLNPSEPSVSVAMNRSTSAASAPHFSVPLNNRPSRRNILSSAMHFSPTKSRRIDFVPYTMKDYKNIQFHKYYELGGLGPANVGTEQWKLKKQSYSRMIDYARQANMINMNRDKKKAVNLTPQRSISFAFHKRRGVELVVSGLFGHVSILYRGLSFRWPSRQTTDVGRDRGRRGRPGV